MCGMYHLWFSKRVFFFSMTEAKITTFWFKTFSITRNGQTMNAQGCGQMWESDFSAGLFSKKECIFSNCNYIYRAPKVTSCYSYGSITRKNSELLYFAGHYATNRCEK
jgi:hypothetical protein